MLGEFTEVESGKVNDRPELGRALELCRMTGAALVIAKLDRLSRDAHFLLGLAKAGVRFVAVDMPNANELTVGIMALVAQEERKAISARTKAALAAAKDRGQKLGGWRGGPVVDGQRGRDAQTKRADDFARQLAGVVGPFREAGQSFAQIAAEMNAKGIMTARGGANWTPAAVRAVLVRLGKA